MRLTDEEKAMLDGKKGEAVRTCMEMLVTLGKVFDAPCMLPVQSAHVSGLSVRTLGDAGIRWAEDLAASGARVCVPSSMNVIGIDRLQPLGLPAEWCEKQERVVRAYESMGCMNTASCTPYYQGFLPRFGEHTAWGESSAVVFLNSVLGARNNREGGPATLASALTGRTPCYGMHLDENRAGTVVCRVETPLKDISDYGALGHFMATVPQPDIPVFENVPAPATEELVMLGASLAAWGSCAMFHMVGVTPEAPTCGHALKGKKVPQVVFGEKELREHREAMNCAKSRAIDLVALGCPHMSLRQLKEIADLLDGRRIKEGVSLWVQTNLATRGAAADLGYVEAIERAGGIVTQDLCVVLSVPEALGFRTLATNSAKMRFYAPGSNKIDVWYGTTRHCIDAALTGMWTE